MLHLSPACSLCICCHLLGSRISSTLAANQWVGPEGEPRPVPLRKLRCLPVLSEGRNKVQWPSRPCSVLGLLCHPIEVAPLDGEAIAMGETSP